MTIALAVLLAAFVFFVLREAFQRAAYLDRKNRRYWDAARPSHPFRK